MIQKIHHFYQFNNYFSQSLSFISYIMFIVIFQLVFYLLLMDTKIYESQPSVRVVYPVDWYFEKVQDLIEGGRIEVLRFLIRKYHQDLQSQFKRLCEESEKGQRPRNVILFQFWKKDQINDPIGQNIYEFVQCKIGLYYRYFGQQSWIRYFNQILQNFLKNHPLQLITIKLQQKYNFQRIYPDNTQAPGVIVCHDQLVFFEKIDIAKELISLRECHRFVDKSMFQTVSEGSFSMISFNKKEFKKYLRRQQIQISQLKITQEFIEFSASQQNYHKFINYTTNFLTQYSLDSYLLTFQSPFQAAIFKELCIPSLSHIKFIQQDGNVEFVEGLRSFQEIDYEINSCLTKVKKQIQLVPIIRLPSCLPKTMKLIQGAPQIKLLSYKLRCFNIDHKVKIRCRSIDSLYRNIDYALFLVSDLSKNERVRQILLQNNFSEVNFTDSIRGKSGKTLIEYCTQKSKYINRTMIWYVNMHQKNCDRIRNEFNELLSLHFKEKKSIRIILSDQNTEMFQLAIPICLGEFYKRYFINQEPGTYVTNIDFIFQKEYEQELCRILGTQLKKILKGTKEENTLKTSSYIPISRFNLERIQTFSYASIYYKLQDSWVELSPIASFYLYFEMSKSQGKKRMLLHLHSDPSYKYAYLIVNQDQKIAMLKADTGGLIKYITDVDQLSQEINTFLDIQKHFYSDVNSLVVYANEQGSLEKNIIYVEAYTKNGEFRIEPLKIVHETEGGKSVDSIKLKMKLNHRKMWFIQTHKAFKNKVRELTKI